MTDKKRNIRMQFRVNEKEKSLIAENMSKIGTNNYEAYFRKMAINGYVIHLETNDVKELVRLLRVTSNSLNQLTKRVHETGNIYGEDIDDLKKSYKNMWDIAEEIMFKLSSI